MRIVQICVCGRRRGQLRKAGPTRTTGKKERSPLKKAPGQARVATLRLFAEELAGVGWGFAFVFVFAVGEDVGALF